MTKRVILSLFQASPALPLPVTMEAGSCLPAAAGQGAAFPLSEGAPSRPRAEVFSGVEGRAYVPVYPLQDGALRRRPSQLPRGWWVLPAMLGGAAIWALLIEAVVLVLRFL